MHLRIFAYSSNILITNFDPMVSMIASGIWKNLRFFLKPCSLRDWDPVMKLICSTCHPWCYNVDPRVRRRDTYRFSARDRDRMRYWSVTSLMRLNSRMQNIPAFVLVGSRSASPSGLSHQDLVCSTDSLLWPAFVSFNSDWVSGRSNSRSLAALHIESAVIFSHFSSSSNSSASSFQIVSKFFSPEMQMKFRLREASLFSSPWISLQHLWCAAVWASDRASHMC